MNTNNLDSNHRTPQYNYNRPLGGLSDFVIDEMPKLLAKINNSTVACTEDCKRDFLAKISRLIFEIPKFEEIESLKSRRLALLDLTMLEASLIHSEIEIPEELKCKTDEFAQKLASSDVLTYEGYILDNPIDDNEARLFMPEDSEARANELFFIKTHREIEVELKKIVTFILKIYGILNNIEEVSIDEYEDEINLESESTAEAMKKINNILVKIRILSSSNFDLLRKYYKSHPNRDTPGPSGAFSGGFQALDILLLDAEDNMSKIKIPNETAFPQYDDHGFVGMPQIRQACFYHKYQQQFYEFIKRNYKVGKNLEFVIQNLLRFRQIHRGVVKRYLPEVLNGNDQPTAHGAEFYSTSEGSTTSPVDNLLNSRIERTKAAILKTHLT